MLEKVQRCATKMVYSLNNLTYEQRLRRLGITTLETRRVRGDLIEAFKIINGFDKVEYLKFFLLSTTALRGHNLKLFKPYFKPNVGKYTFSNRVIDCWHRLPEEIIACDTLDNLRRN